ncbi:MAG: Sec-independent protein translocase protein TatB [Aestuariivirga sp.]
MFDFGVGYTEIFLIAVVAIIVIGPKDLPAVLRAFGKTMAKMRGMAREFQGHLDGAMREAGLEDVKKDLQSLKNIGDIEPVPKSKVVPAKPADNDFAKYFGDGKPAPDAP